MIAIVASIQSDVTLWMEASTLSSPRLQHMVRFALFFAPLTWVDSIHASTTNLYALLVHTDDMGTLPFLFLALVFFVEDACVDPSDEWCDEVSAFILS